MPWWNPTTWWLDEENLQAGNEAYQKSQELNRATRERIAQNQGPDAAAAYWRKIEQNAAGQIVTVDEARSQLADAFREGLAEAVDTRKRQLHSAVGGLLGAVPWPLWLLGALALWVFLGGKPFLRKPIN